MFTHILLATDGSELAQKGVRHGVALAAALRARVTALHVSEPYPVYGLGEPKGWSADTNSMADYAAACEEAAQLILGEAKRVAEREEVPCETLYIAGKAPADGILEAAQARGCDLIVMASHGRRGLSRMLLGSQTLRVTTESTAPVLVVK